MNLKEYILSFLKIKDWDMLQKIYYVYLYMCKTFSYDFRYELSSKEEQQKYYDKEFDATNINEFEITCNSWCKIAKSIYDDLDPSIKCSISYDVLPHVFLIVEYWDYKIKLDPMKYGYDITRVKIGCNTHGFFDLNQNTNLMPHLKRIISFEKNSTSINKVITATCGDLKGKDMYRNVPYQIDTFDNEPFKLKMDLINFIINNANEIKRFDDTDRLFDYLSIKFMTEWERYKIHKHPFWQIEQGNWKIVDLILLELENEKSICYKMCNKDGKFIITPIEYREMDYYLDHYDSKVQGVYRELTKNYR